MPQCSKMAIMIQKFKNGKFLNFEFFFALEPSCCKKWQKVATEKLVWGMGMSEGAE